MKVMVIESLDFKDNDNIGNIRAYTTLRGLSGDVADNFSCFNVCDYTGDTPEHVNMCRQELCRLLSIETSHLIMPRQTHTANVAVVDKDMVDADAETRRSMLQDIDALVTALPEVAIGVNTADCVPIVLRDAATGIIGVAHAGWRGSVMHIGAHTVEAMVKLGANANCIEAAIGASICPDCFEVGDEVVDKFTEAGFHGISHRNATTGKAYIDLWQANVNTLIEAGVSPYNINISGKCTRCNPSRYFSARRLGIHSGRTFTTIIRY